MSTTLLVVLGVAVVLFFMFRNKRESADHNSGMADDHAHSSADHHGAHGSTHDSKMTSSKGGGRKRSGCC